MTAPETEKLLASLQPLFQLNPHIVQATRRELLELASSVPPEDFPRIAETADSLVESFLAAPWKSSEKNILNEFRGYLLEAYGQMRQSGEISADGNNNGEEKSNHTVALALPQSFTALEWFRLLEGAAVPTRLNNSVDAVNRRNQLTSTVLPQMFEVLLRIDSQQAFAWFENFLHNNRGRLDQDVVRDILESWRARRPLPEKCLNWLFTWCANEDLRQQWPAVSDTADRVLRVQLFERWLPRVRTHPSPLLQHLARIGTRLEGSEAALRQWQQQAVAELGRAVTAFIDFSRYLPDETPPLKHWAGKQDWSQEAVFLELKKMETLFSPVMLFADALLQQPDGSYSFALSLLGFPPDILEAWRQRLLEETRRMVYQSLLNDIKADRQPIGTIRTYSAGDKQLYRYLLSQLDLVSRTFGNLEQRDKVAEQLAIHFSSLREAQLLPRELTARYRKLMRTLHEDSLRRLLSPGQLRESENFTIRRDLLTIAAEARRYTQRRRALNTEVEEMLSSRFDFEKNIRRKRLQLAREQLHTQNIQLS